LILLDGLDLEDCVEERVHLALGYLGQLLLQDECDLVFADSALVIGESEHESEEEQLSVLIVHLLGELLDELTQHFDDLESAVLVEVGDVLDEVVDVLVESGLLHGVLDEELDEDLAAGAPDGLAHVGDHHLLDLLFHHVVHVSTHELLVDERVQTVEHIHLQGVNVEVLSDDRNQGMELLLGEILEDSVLLDQLAHASEERVQEVCVAVACVFEQLEDLVNELLAVQLETGQSHVDDVRYDVKSGHNDGVIVDFEGFEQQRHEWV
jgi:hypothetical protein